MNCEFCNKDFATKGNLKNHQLTAKYCLELRSSKNDKWKCEYCEKSLASKQNLEQHLGKCLSKHVFNRQDQEIKQLKSELKMKENFYRQQIQKLEEQNKDLQNQLKEVAIKAIDKETIVYNNENIDNRTVNTSTNKMIDNRVLNLIPFNLSQDQIMKTLEEKFTENHLYLGQKGLAQFCIDNMLKIDDKMMMKCTDQSRKIFLYLDEEGKLCKDVNAYKFTDIIYEPAINASTKICESIPKKYPTENDRLDFALSKKNEIVNIKVDNNEFVRHLIPGLISNTFISGLE